MDSPNGSPEVLRSSPRSGAGQEAKSGKSRSPPVATGTPSTRRKKHKPNNLYDFDPNFFHKKNSKPALMQVQVKMEDLQHLKEDDIDDVSKLEVTYKILKEQLRNH